MYSRVVGDYFQILDHKSECVGYYQSELVFGGMPTGKYTWNFHPDVDAEFAQLYVGGKQIHELKDFSYLENWQKVKNRKIAFLKSFQKSKVDLNKHCFYDLVPESFLVEYNFFKNKATEHVVENFEKPENYDFLVELSLFADKVKKQALLFDSSKLLLFKLSLKSHVHNFINYNIFGTVTGRLSTFPNSFPILTLPKKHRGILRPHNDKFLELDINAAEIRIFLGLLGKKQPENDIHQWNIEHVFKDKSMSRQDAKSRFFAWFYNPNNVDLELQNVYDRDYLLQRHYNGKTVQNPYKRTIEADDFHALNYLIQSTTNDVILRNILKIDKLLDGRKSFVSFTMHDSVVIDWHSEDFSLLQQLYDTFTMTDYGKFIASAGYGDNFGELHG